jgi:hypothetical protein
VDAHWLVRSRGSHFLDNRLTDGGEVVSLSRRAHLYPQEDFWYSFLLGSTADRIRSNEKSNDVSGNRIRDLPVCNIMPHLTLRNQKLFVILCSQYGGYQKDCLLRYEVGIFQRFGGASFLHDYG